MALPVGGLGGHGGLGVLDAEVNLKKTMGVFRPRFLHTILTISRLDASFTLLQAVWKP